MYSVRSSVHPLAVVVIFFGIIMPPLVFSSPFFILSMIIPMLIFITYIEGFQKLKSYIFMFTFFFVISFLVNFIFTNTGTTIIFQIDNIPVFGGHKRLSLEMLIFTFTSSLRLLYIIMLFTFISIISSEDRMMSFFSLFLGNFPLLLSFTIRLIPKLRTDYSRLNHVFKLRGFDIKKESEVKSNRIFLIFKRIKNTFNTELLIALMRTLLMNSLEDSIQYAEAMQSRGFGYSSRRSSFFKETFNLIDILFIILSVLYIALSFILVFSLNIGTKDIYPIFRLRYYINKYEILGIIFISVINIIFYMLSSLLKNKK